MYVTPTVWLMMGMTVFCIIIVIFAIIMHRKTFKNVARIARQTGKELSDVVWIDDRFRVKNIDGHWVIQFLRLREKTQSIEGKFWMSFFHPKKQQKFLKYTKEEWDRLQVSKHIQRGIYFYETIEGEFFPMEIAKDQKSGPHFKILTQDNRMFLINEFKNINSLTQNRKMEMLTLIGIIVACVVLGVIFVFGIIYLNETSKATQQAQVADCANYARAVFNITSTGQPTFIDSVTGRIGSTPGG